MQTEMLLRQPEVRRALDEATGRRQSRPVRLETRHRLTLGTTLLLLLALAVLHYALRDPWFDFLGEYHPVAQRLTLGAIAALLVLGLARLVDALWIARLDSPVTQYNLRRVLNLVVGTLLTILVLSLIFANWYTAVVSLGLISVVLGFALQTPITSFIGWLYLMAKAPYRVGDRVRIGDFQGDVIDVGYLDTTLWEFGGEYLSTDHPSGRIIKFPNSMVLETAVHNYSWPLFPYVWNEIKFQIAYQSDLEFVREVMRSTAAEELGPDMPERIETYRQLLAQTPVDELVVKEHPSMAFRVSENTWVEAIVRYLVAPRAAGTVKTRLITKMLTRLKAEPDRVMFPKGDSR